MITKSEVQFTVSAIGHPAATGPRGRGCVRVTDKNLFPSHRSPSRVAISIGITETAVFNLPSVASNLS